MLFTAVLINVLSTYSMRREGTSSVSAWFFHYGISNKFSGINVLPIRRIWLHPDSLDGRTNAQWLGPSALMFAVAYHIIPYNTQKPIWSHSLLTAGMILLFVTVPPFFIGEVNAGNYYKNRSIIIDIFTDSNTANCFNLLATASSNSSAVF